MGRNEIKDTEDDGGGDAMFAFVNGIVEVIGRIIVPRGLTAVSQIGVWGI